MKSFREYLKEEFNTTSLTLYTRCDIPKFNDITEFKYENLSHVHFYMYNGGMYCFSELKSALNPDAARRYGDYILKFTIPGGTKNFFYTSYNAYKQAVNSNAKDGEYADNVPFIDEQLKRFGLDKKKLLSKKIYPASKYVYKPAQNKDEKLLSSVFERTIGSFEGVENFQGFVRYLETSGYIPKYIKGFEYYSKEDENAFIVFDNKAIVPLTLYDTKGNKIINVSKQTKEIGYKNSRKNISVEKIQKSKIQDIKSVFLQNQGIDSFLEAPETYIIKTTFKGKMPSVCKSLDARGNFLKNFVGSPERVLESLNVSDNLINSLEGFPKTVGEEIVLSNNSLMSLDGLPKDFNGFLNVSYNNLTSLEGCPQYLYFFHCNFNKLTSFSGGPKLCFDFECTNNKLTSLKGAPRVNEDFFCNHNKLTVLDYEVDGPGPKRFYCSNNPISKKEIIRFSKKYPKTEVISDFGIYKNGEKIKN